ncbi:MAG: RNase adapter RapZ [Bacteroidota bacterium]|nr:phosphotransferase [Prolixibacteraceae bacterium]MDI9563718.1 RNase adapter RapZ [Bacteroidota bacterium]OQB81545.1 MAG: glmZ(sRNA)-inactivating NTPase [Bacteroidetes bacterium ADurb.Bin123]HNZ68843.1 RNase adapter RapZ [Prolixibacteraceae bacterium]HOC86438.1 RNase adapter RapZ [Prolixibacteraceae bacterium]
MDQKVLEILGGLFREYTGHEAELSEVLPHSGSYREYVRLRRENFSAIGTYNADIKENRAFISFSRHFRESGIPVPEILLQDEDPRYYLQEDLGSVTLFDFLNKTRIHEGFSRTIIDEYKKVLSILPSIQVTAGKTIDYSVCYPRAAFDMQSMKWDLSYFKYYFLKLAKIPFDEQLLEDDFSRFTDYLLSADNHFFMYRDFQSRNIMLRDGKVFFIDYQGGRRGALQYDLASLLYDGKADIPQRVRDELFEFYLDQLEKILPVDRYEFIRYFKGFVLIRIMQSMGAYGFRGFYEKKEHFLKSIPYALDNLEAILQKLDLPVELPELVSVLNQVAHSSFLRSIGQKEHNLTVRITSFSYKKGIPQDPSGNGGGFVFDCRAIHNPGKYPEFKTLTGQDAEVQHFLEDKSEMPGFLQAIKVLIDQSVKKYIARGFSHLSVNFGCTGGQHRSVFAAEILARHLKNNFPVNVILVHRELEQG